MNSYAGAARAKTSISRISTHLSKQQLSHPSDFSAFCRFFPCSVSFSLPLFKRCLYDAHEFDCPCVTLTRCLWRVTRLVLCGARSPAPARASRRRIPNHRAHSCCQLSQGRRNVHPSTLFVSDHNQSLILVVPFAFAHPAQLSYLQNHPFPPPNEAVNPTEPQDRIGAQNSRKYI